MIFNAIRSRRSVTDNRTTWTNRLNNVESFVQQWIEFSVERNLLLNRVYFIHTLLLGNIHVSILAYTSKVQKMRH